MENRYAVQGDATVIDIPYKKEVIQVIIDTEDLPLVSSCEGKWQVKRQKNVDSMRFQLNTNRTVFMHRLIAHAKEGDIVYFKDNNHKNLRKNNLSINKYEVGEEIRNIRKRSYHNMSEEAKANLLRGMRENRYSKEWSDQLSSTKKGQSNPSSKLNEDVVLRIREAYEKGDVSQQTLADEFKVARTTIADILNYRIWNEIGEEGLQDYRIYREDRMERYEFGSKIPPYRAFTNEFIALSDFVLRTNLDGREEYIFVQKIGRIKLYVEVRNHLKEFVHSFEVVFPENITFRNKHNYIISQRKPKNGKKSSEIHTYMSVISSYVLQESVI